MEDPKIQNFDNFKKRIERKAPKSKKKYKEEGFCMGVCDRHIITEDGKRMIVCDGCNRIVHSL